MKEKCCLCKKETDEETHLYVGGCISHAHRSCVDIVETYIKRLENYEGIIKKINSERLKKSFEKEKIQ